jgi:hypothetical protein
MTASQLDLRRALPDLYSAGPDPTVVEVPELTFLAIDGRGDPNTSAGYAQAVQALYAMAYGVHFALKRRPGGLDARVMPLEGLWWVPDMSLFRESDKDAWLWRLLIAQPEQVTAGTVAEVRAAATAKKPGLPLDRVRLERFAEGRCAQVLHRGPYAEEAPTIERLHRYIADRGYRLTGRHHEIYLGDPRRAAPEKLRTILRQPVADAGPEAAGQR